MLNHYFSLNQYLETHTDGVTMIYRIFLYLIIMLTSAIGIGIIHGSFAHVSLKNMLLAGCFMLVAAFSIHLLAEASRLRRREKDADIES